MAIVILCGHATSPRPCSVKRTRYRERMEERLSRYRERLEEAMTAHKIPEARRTTARRALVDLERASRTAIERVTRDGSVTQAEADEVRALTKKGREAIYHALGIERAKGE